jgi:predicted RNase H-like HicB family nuclease
MARFLALIDGKAGAYGVVFPDAPGCHAMGETMDEALRNAAEALSEWAADEVAAGREVPAPRPLEELLHDPEVIETMREDGAVPSVVPLVLNAGRSMRANISLDAGLLSAIDEAAERNGLSRSAFLSTAAREKIASGR